MWNSALYSRGGGSRGKQLASAIDCILNIILSYLVYCLCLQVAICTAVLILLRVAVLIKYLFMDLCMYSVYSVGHRHFHTGSCNVPPLPRELLEHHKAIITYVPIFLLCSCNAIYLLLTSFDRSLNRSWSCEVKHWIMSQVPSAGMPNLGQKAPSTYGCHIKFYIIIGSDGAMRRIQWEWIDIGGR